MGSPRVKALIKTIVFGLVGVAGALMIAAARKLSHELGGDLKDEQRSVLTAQTIEHYRQRIAEYERLSYSQRR